jgi:E3 ubiquitin-protein ligase UBR4
VRDATYAYTVHDLKHLLIKFAHEKSFSEDTGGGGRESNIYLVPYLMHMALYVINTTRSVGREERNLSNFLKLPVDKWVENSFETEGPLYWTVMALHVHDHEGWKRIRIQLLKRLVVLAQARTVSPGGANSLTDKVVKEYAVYKPYLMFFGLANLLPNSLFAKCHPEQESTWSLALAEYIRNSDQILQDNAKKVLSTFEDELLPCESVYEFCDVAGLLEDIADPENLVSDVLRTLP